MTLEQYKKANAEAWERVRELEVREAAAYKEFESMTTAERLADMMKEKGARKLREVEQVQHERKRAEMIAKLTRHNERAAVLELCVSALVELLKKYEGKAAGEKTIKKFFDELKTLTGCRGYFKRSFLSLSSKNIVIWGDSVYMGDSLDLWTVGDAEFLTDANKFNSVNVEDFAKGMTFEKVEDISQRVADIERMRANISEFAERYNTAADKLHALTFGEFEHIKKIY